MTLLRRFLYWLANAFRDFANWLNEQPGDDSSIARPRTNAESAAQSEDEISSDGDRVLATPELDLETPELPRYTKRTWLLTDVEHRLFRNLLAAVGQEYQIFAKVRLGDVMALQNRPHDYKYHIYQIMGKHFDFVLCHLITTEPLLAIELDDPSHEYFNRIKSDLFKDKVCEEVGLPLLRLHVSQRMSAAELAQEIHTRISPSGASAKPG